tara:strand:- start:651 stop:881 length:231 start_codon:yes stop_codon:yes gene_type:complete
VGPFSSATISEASDAKTNALNDLQELGYGRHQIVRTLMRTGGVQDMACVYLTEGSEDEARAISDDFVSEADENMKW